jgi:hypothetical protein
MWSLEPDVGTSFSSVVSQALFRASGLKGWLGLHARHIKLVDPESTGGQDHSITGGRRTSLEHEDNIIYGSEFEDTMASRFVRERNQMELRLFVADLLHRLLCVAVVTDPQLGPALSQAKTVKPDEIWDEEADLDSNYVDDVSDGTSDDMVNEGDRTSDSEKVRRRASSCFAIQNSVFWCCVILI